MFKVGDKVRGKNFTTIWTITDHNVVTDFWELESKNSWNLTFSKWVDDATLKADYFKVESEYDYEQLTLFSGTSNEKYCTHEWKVYNSGWTAFEYCSKCNEERELK